MVPYLYHPNHYSTNSWPSSQSLPHPSTSTTAPAPAKQPLLQQHTTATATQMHQPQHRYPTTSLPTHGRRANDNPSTNNNYTLFFFNSNSFHREVTPSTRFLPATSSSIACSNSIYQPITITIHSCCVNNICAPGSHRAAIFNTYHYSSVTVA
jgi:hypothetical protein